jgi:predicted cupin superfamily sugar epimerase
MQARALIRKLGLLPHPEGGHYREIRRAPDEVETPRGRRSALTEIFFLLRKGERSLFHRVLSEEIWHHYEGANLELIRLSPDFREKEIFSLGPLRGRSRPVAVIPAGHWQAARSRGDYTLVGCTVGPGFDFADFTLLRDAAPEAAQLKARHPGLSRFVG